MARPGLRIRPWWTVISSLLLHRFAAEMPQSGRYAVQKRLDASEEVLKPKLQFPGASSTSLNGANGLANDLLDDYQSRLTSRTNTYLLRFCFISFIFLLQNLRLSFYSETAVTNVYVARPS